MFNNNSYLYDGMIGLAILLILVLVFFAVRTRLRYNRAGRGERLGVVEVYQIDEHRNLMLVRRDNTEHLLLVGGGHDIVIEANISKEQAPALRQAPRSSAAPVEDEIVPFRRAPRAAFAERPAKPAPKSLREDPEI